MRHGIVSIEECNPWQRAIETIKDHLEAFDVHSSCRRHGKRQRTFSTYTGHNTTTLGPT
jgi:hypothetical protein